MNKKIIAIIAAVVLVVGGGLAIFFATRGGAKKDGDNQGSSQDSGQDGGSSSLPNDAASLIAALNAKQALNCSYIVEENGMTAQMTHQVAAGGTKQKIRVTGEQLVEGEVLPVDLTSLVLEGEAIYVWGDEGATTNMAMKIDWDSWQALDAETQGGLNPSLELEQEQESLTRITCREPEANDFSVPEKQWMDLSSMLQSLGDL